MAALLWLAEAIVLGVLLVWRFGRTAVPVAGWARGAFVLGAGTAAGIGLTACLFFVVGVLLGRAPIAMGLELALLAWSGYEVARGPRVSTGPTPKSRRAVQTSLCATGALLAFGLAVAAIAAGWQANPHGGWDAWAIWNLRARFLVAGPPLAERAWSPVLSGSTHPEYPLLLSAIVARCWAFAGNTSVVAPIGVAFAFFTALLATVGGAIAALRGPVLGLAAVMVLAATPALVHEVPAQYGDVPLACYFAAAVACALLEQPLLAGIFAGFAAWTKDEGLLFLVLFLVATGLLRRRQLGAALAGALPVGLLTLLFKMLLPHGTQSLASSSLPGAVPRILDATRYGTIVAEYARTMAGWWLPILPLIALAVVLRFDPKQRRETAFPAGLGAAMLLGYFGFFVITAADLQWQLQTALGRLLVQVWPLLILALFMILRQPETYAAIPAAVVPKARRKAKGKVS